MKQRAVLAAFLILAGCGKGLNGTYVKCVAALSNSTRTGFTYDSTAGSVALKKESFTTLNCSGTATVQVDTSGTYVENSSTVQSATNIDMSFTQGTFTGSALFQIYRLDSNNLLLGDVSGANTGLSSDKRPMAFEGTPYLKQ